MRPRGWILPMCWVAAMSTAARADDISLSSIGVTVPAPDQGLPWQGDGVQSLGTPDGGTVVQFKLTGPCPTAIDNLSKSVPKTKRAARPDGYPANWYAEILESKAKGLHYQYACVDLEIGTGLTIVVAAEGKVDVAAAGLTQVLSDIEVAWRRNHGQVKGGEPMAFEGLGSFTISDPDTWWTLSTTEGSTDIMRASPPGDVVVVVAHDADASCDEWRSAVHGTAETFTVPAPWESEGITTDSDTGPVHAVCTQTAGGTVVSEWTSAGKATEAEDDAQRDEILTAAIAALPSANTTTTTTEPDTTDTSTDDTETASADDSSSYSGDYSPGTGDYTPTSEPAPEPTPTAPRRHGELFAPRLSAGLAQFHPNGGNGNGGFIGAIELPMHEVRKHVAAEGMASIRYGSGDVGSALDVHAGIALVAGGQAWTVGWAAGVGYDSWSGMIQRDGKPYVYEGPRVRFSFQTLGIGLYSRTWFRGDSSPTDLGFEIATGWWSHAITFGFVHSYMGDDSADAFTLGIGR